MQIKTLKLKDVNYGNQWFDETEDHWNYCDYKADPAWCEGWISFDCSLYNKNDNRIYLGITSFAADIFKAYDRNKGEFVDLGYKLIADPFDAKFHRSLEMNDDGSIYAAIALLHDVDDFHNAPGGAIVKYSPKSGDLTKLAIPLPHVYIQSIALDQERQLLYCLHFAPEYLSVFNLETAEVRNLGLIGPGCGVMAQGENIILDDTGNLWGSWSVTRAWQSSPGVDAVRLLKYNPDADNLTFFKHGLPHPDGRHGFAKPEAFFNFHDGSIYASGESGSFYRIDPENADVQFLFQPTHDRPSRLSSLVQREPGIVYGVTGRDGACEFLRIDLKNDSYEKLGEITDEDGAKLWQCHHISVTDDGVFYVCENDNPYRSSYLWEISL